MTIPSIADLGNIYIPPPLGALELNLGDEWRARFTDADELPVGAPLAYGYAVLYMGDKGYVSRLENEPAWGTVEGRFNEGEKPEAWLKRLALEQMGATPGKVALIGYLDCRATSHNKEYEPGTTTVQPIYLVAARSIKDLPESSPYLRRRLPINEHSKALRKRYPELEKLLIKAFDRYALWQAKGEA